jgi:leader peptidase (prepilin peptidase)/N-methyltransferase
LDQFFYSNSLLGFILAFFLIGILLGSFLGTVVDRLPRGENPLDGRSFCDHCRKTLGVFDLIPLFSFLFLKGRCRYCKARLSWFYPAIELVTGSMFALTAVHCISSDSQLTSLASYFFLVLCLIIVSCLIVIFFTDLKYGLIPFFIVVIAFVVTFLFLAQKVHLQTHILASLGEGTFFLSLFFGTKKKGIGFGDVIYSFFMGFLLGFPKVIPGLYITFLTGASVAIILVLWGKKRFKGGTIPLGPFLVVGTYMAWIWGDWIIYSALPILLGS